MHAIAPINLERESSTMRNNVAYKYVGGYSLNLILPQSSPNRQPHPLRQLTTVWQLITDYVQLCLPMLLFLFLSVLYLGVYIFLVFAVFDLDSFFNLS